MQKFYVKAFSYENKKLKEHNCDFSIDFEGLYHVMVDGNIPCDKDQLADVRAQECYIFDHFDKFKILEKYKKRKFKYMVFIIDKVNKKVNENEIKDFAFALFSGIILENFEL